MVYDKEPLKVIRTLPGRGTGDTVCVTEDGRCWRNLQPYEEYRHPGTTEKRATQIGNVMFEE